MNVEKILKKLQPAIVQEMDGMDKAQLEKVIVQSQEAIAEATDARDANSQYRAAKQATKDLSAGLKEVKSYQTAKMQYALIRLREG